MQKFKPILELILLKWDNFPLIISVIEAQVLLDF